MGKIIKHILVEIGFGIGQGLVVSPNREFVRPSKEAFRMDNARLRKDANKVSNDLRNSLKQYS
jgi:hypothetical protein